MESYLVLERDRLQKKGWDLGLRTGPIFSPLPPNLSSQSAPPVNLTGLSMRTL